MSLLVPVPVPIGDDAFFHAHHFHLVMETPEANLVAGMSWLLRSYTIRLNHRHKLFGHVFSGRCKALLVEAAVMAT